MDRFDQLERAHALYLDLSCNVEHFVHALEMLHQCEFHAMHWALWSACMCKTHPEEAGETRLLRRARERLFRSGATQAELFGSTGT